MTLRRVKPVKRPDIGTMSTDGLLALVRCTDDRDILVCPFQRRVWAEIARRGGVK